MGCWLHAIGRCLASAYLLAVLDWRRWHFRLLTLKAKRWLLESLPPKASWKLASWTFNQTAARLLAEYKPIKEGALFPGMRGVSPTLTRFAADKILKGACDRVGLVGVSTHSWRHTALTMMSSADIPLRVIQEISGHNDERDIAALFGSVTRAEAIGLCLRSGFDLKIFIQFHHLFTIGLLALFSPGDWYE